ncbi:MAG: hypothetical protein Phyf2KO_11230 [Phycisphaerales bacterium]
MSDRFSRPYRTAAPEAIETEPWTRFDPSNESWTELGPELPGWDPAMDLRLQRRCVIDADEVRNACRLLESDSISLAVTAWSRDAGVRACLHRIEIIGSGRHPLQVECQLIGRRTAGEVVLRTELVTSGSVHSAEVFAPPGPGCVLWSDEFTLEVEGAGSQFPIESGNFAEMPWIPGSNAPWHVELESDVDLEEPVLRAIRLYINSGHEIMREYEQHPHISAIVRYDVARVLLTTVLPRNDFAEQAESFDRKSLGGVVRNLAESLFPGWPLRDLAEDARNRPAEFETSLRSALELFND